MPWHQEPTKDVTSCDKPRLAANKLTRGFPNGETPDTEEVRSPNEYIVEEKGTLRTETSK